MKREESLYFLYYVIIQLLKRFLGAVRRPRDCSLNMYSYVILSQNQPHVIEAPLSLSILINLEPGDFQRKNCTTS